MLFYICSFEACWYFIFNSQTNQYAIFVYGFPVFVVGYFCVMGKLFHDKLKLSRWVLWLWMNIAGFILSLIILTITYPILWFNAAMAFLMLPMLGVFTVLWGILGVTKLLINWHKKKHTSSQQTDSWKKF